MIKRHKEQKAKIQHVFYESSGSGKQNRKEDITKLKNGE